MSESSGSGSKLRDHLANERTFLAWIRTSITMLALGFVVAKFGLLLRELGGKHIHRLTAEAGAFVGVGLVVIGAAAALAAAVKFLRTRSDIERSQVNFSPLSDVVLAVLVAIASIVLAAYIIITA